ncbi:MAG: ABC transporter substrate-binding protein, partial [Burkholderiaceae bacterium]
MRSRRAALRWLGLAGWVGAGGYPSAQPALPRVVGVLWFASESHVTQRAAMFRQRLRELGQIEGRTLVLDQRYAEGSMSRLDERAREFVRARVAVIVTPALAATMAARRATDTIPIVMIHAGDPIGAGLIASLARPGGNVTGTSNVPLGAKHIELMHEITPHMRRLAVLVNPSNAGARLFIASLGAAAQRLG